MPSYTTLPYESPRCVACGRNLPKGRKLKCYICRPPKATISAPQIPPEESKKSATQSKTAQHLHGLMVFPTVRLLQSSRTIGLGLRGYGRLCGLRAAPTQAKNKRRRPPAPPQIPKEWRQLYNEIIRYFFAFVKEVMVYGSVSYRKK